MRTVHIFNIMVGSPSDVIDIARKSIEVINLWNVHHSEDKGIVLVPHHWSSSSYPSLKVNSAQGVINSQLVDKCDALVAIFGSKFGTPTKNHPSGTAEEIAEVRKAGKEVMIFFSKQIDLDIAGMEQVSKLQEYKNTIEGLYETFQDLSDFEKKFSQKLNLFVQNEFQPLVAENVSNSKGEKTVLFSEEEIEIIQQWCNSSIDYCSQVAFIGGHHMFRFGPVQIETENPKETAKFIEFIKRLEAAGFIEFQKFDNRGKPRYSLTLEAYERFRED